MILDLHTHTRHSHDGFTTSDELLAACVARGIDAVAVTEHDLPCAVDPAPFIEHGVEVISGCEFTDSKGAHIIGLFVCKGLPTGQPTEAVLDHIHGEGGLAVMPHPWKPGSGFMSMGCDDRLAARFDFIEFINGGWRSGERSPDIVRLATDHGLRMISSSDSHKASQLGLCCIRIRSATHGGNARAALNNARQDDIELLIDRNALAKHGRYSNAVQRSAPYQAILPIIPPLLRRMVKLARYKVGSERHSHPANFEIVDVGSSTW